jgi:hypothetical protein
MAGNRYGLNSYEASDTKRRLWKPLRRVERSVLGEDALKLLCELKQFLEECEADIDMQEFESWWEVENEFAKVMFETRKEETMGIFVDLYNTFPREQAR